LPAGSPHQLSTILFPKLTKLNKQKQEKSKQLLKKQIIIAGSQLYVLS